MRYLDSSGVERPERVTVRHPDLVKRDFIATVPNQLRATDWAFVLTWARVAHLWIIIDAFFKIKVA